jgi:hypothetical protein
MAINDPDDINDILDIIDNLDRDVLCKILEEVERKMKERGEWEEDD